MIMLTMAYNNFHKISRISPCAVGITIAPIVRKTYPHHFILRRLENNNIFKNITGFNTLSSVLFSLSLSSSSGERSTKRQIFCRSFKKSTMATLDNGNGSLCRQNYNEECEALINKQINMELYASYVYLSMAYYFDREDVALRGFHNFFKNNSDEEREHAQLFMKYQNKRGGRVVLQPVSKPSRDEWDGPLEAVTAALELEKTVNQMLLDLHGVASRNSDAHLCDFLETHFLEEQVKAIKELSDQITNLKRVDKGLGEYILDKDLKV